MAYYFVALVMGLVDGMNLPDRTVVVLVIAVLLLTMLVLDTAALRNRARRMDVTLDKIHDDDAALVADLERRLGGQVKYYHINEINYVRDTMHIDVRYQVETHVRGRSGTDRRDGGGVVTGSGGASSPATAATDTTSAGRAVAAAAATVEPIGLAALNELAELQTRVDRKYFVPADVFGRLIAELTDQLRVLDIDELRSFDYESVYFDTPELFTYRARLQRRRLRFKARTRTYLDSGLTMFEVKLTGTRGETVKRRVPHPLEHRAELTDEALAHLATTLYGAYHQNVPPAMRPTLVTACRRTTFVSRTDEMRLTCDTGLVCWDQHHEVRDSGTHVLVESKSGTRAGSVADRMLRGLGVQPTSVSKYAVAVAALHPELPSNPWHEALRRYFTPLHAAV